MTLLFAAFAVVPIGCTAFLYFTRQVTRRMSRENSMQPSRIEVCVVLVFDFVSALITTAVWSFLMNGLFAIRF